MWSLTVGHGMHNHDFPKYPEGQSLGKLTKGEYVDVCEASRSGLRPNAILTLVKRNNDKNYSTQRHIQNAMIKFKKEQREGRTPLAQLFKLLKDNHYHVFTRKASDSDVIGDIFFSHPMAYNMLNSFPYVLQGDCTYNTNVYGLAVLQILGFTCTGKNFTVAYAFLQNEREDNYAWALQNLRMLFQDDKLPSVMYTDRDLAFINAVERVLPETAHYLYRRHIEVNVRARALKLTGSKDFSEAYMRHFNWAISAGTYQEWAARWQWIEDHYNGHPELLQYTKSTWINPYSEKILSMYTDDSFHFGTHTTNRVEAEHSRLKLALSGKKCTFDTVFKAANEIMDIQINIIKDSMERSKTRVPVILREVDLFRDICGKVSRRALDIIRAEVTRIDARQIGVDESVCGCYYRRTHGLPCAHEIVLTYFSGGTILLSSIHEFWKKLDIEIEFTSEENSISQPEYEQLWTELQNAPPLIQKQLFKTIKDGLNPLELGFSSPPHTPDAPRKSTSSRILSAWERTAKIFKVPTKSTSSGKGSRCSYIASTQGSPQSLGSSPTAPPTNATPTSKSRPPRSPASNPGPARSRGRGKGRGKCRPSTADILHSSYAGDLIPVIIPFVKDFVNVKSDGNCGYRAVALHIYGDEKFWGDVRRDCCNELAKRTQLYARILCLYTVPVLYSQIAHFGDGTAPVQHWLEMPDVGHVIATCYNIIVVSYGLHGGMTCFPVTVDPGVGPPQQILVLGNVAQHSHWILLHMNDDSPMPLPALHWEENRDPSASHLMGPYMTRIQAYKDLH